ncbi:MULTISPECIES: hypothetical protein [unclassified Rhodanobacter]|uniref:hypothetical protein n=1 Tax=unclassified Rhodanobacter TaxID=2621553 RepID=UPI0012F7FAC8|nr:MULTISPECIES: hypothetical protein [unclassified Rhodanobacter]
MRRITSLLALLLPISVLCASESPADPAALRVHLMETTKVIGVMGVEGSSTDFKDDGDPDTLEIVLLSKKSDGPSRVSPDGEVVFLYKASDEEQSELIGKAFDLRVARRLGGN